MDYEQLIEAADDGSPPDQALGGPMFYTSGTTGRPKRCAIEHLRRRRSRWR